MAQPGRELKAKLTTLMCKHNVRPIARAPIPLLSPTAGPQVLEGYAATPDVDAERMSFKRGALTWPGDLSKLPLLVRHDTSRVAGRILDLDYDVDGRLFTRAGRRSRSALFGSKEPFTVEALRRYIGRWQQRASPVVDDPKMHAPEKQRVLVAAATDGAQQTSYSFGCLIGNLSAELSSEHESIRSTPRYFGTGLLLSTP
jgi:hypothetical protein